MFPMVAGLSPFLGNGYKMVVPTDSGAAPVIIESGAPTGYEKEGGPGQVLARTSGWRADSDQAAAPVAILTSRRTASAGEDVAVQFRGRPEARSFGSVTRGEASGNVTLPQASGTVFVITAGLFADRNGATYRDGLQPDEVVREDAAHEDGVIDAAQRWLATKAVCQRPAA